MIKFYNSNINKEVVIFLRKIVNKKLSPKSAFEIYKLSLEMENIFKAKVATEINIFNKYGKTGDDGKKHINPEDVKQFQADMTELNSIEHTIELEKIELNVTKNLFVEEISADTIHNVSFLFTFVE